MRINEIFHSIQGEGLHAGLPMTFIRFQGCPFNCSYCDTGGAQDFNGGTKRTVKEIVSQVQYEWVCITGGEPLSQPRDLMELVDLLIEDRHRIEIETSGLTLLPTPNLWDVESWVVDVKCPSSGMSEYNRFDNLLYLRSQDQVKFVVGTDKDLSYTRAVLNEYPKLPNVLISPILGSGIEKAAVDFVMKQDGRLSIQLHKVLGVR